MTDDREQSAAVCGSALDRQAEEMLRTIAKSLNCSVDVFFGEDNDMDNPALNELLSLWRAATNCLVRQRILEFARQEVAANDD